MMYLFLIRHGEANPLEEKSEQVLTERGIQDTKKCGRFLRDWLYDRHTLSLIIRHSGKSRAEKTAHLLAGAICGNPPIEFCEGLNPNDDTNIIKKHLEHDAANTMALVGHMPHLSRLAADLLTGNPDKEIIRFKNAAIACLVKENRSWHLEWMISPEILF